MASISLRNFNGMVPRADERALQPGMASAAVNCKLWSSQLRPWNGLVEHAVLGKAGEIRTLYRAFKEAGKDASGVFFHWNEVVDVARGHINADSRERTYFTGAGKPQMTDNSIAMAGGDEYPMASHDLGVPVPDGTMSVTVGQDIVKTHSYKVTNVGEYPKGSGILYESQLSSQIVRVVRQPRQKVSLINIPVWKKKTKKVVSKRIYRSTTLKVPVSSIDVLSDSLKIDLEYPHGLKKFPTGTLVLEGCDQNSHNGPYYAWNSTAMLVEDEEDSIIIPRKSGTPAEITGDSITLTYDLDPEMVAEIPNEQDKWIDEVVENAPFPRTTVNVVGISIDGDRVTFALDEDANIEAGSIVRIDGANQSAYDGVGVTVVEVFSNDKKTFVFSKPSGAGSNITTNSVITVTYAESHDVLGRGVVDAAVPPFPNAKFMSAENLEATDEGDVESRSYVLVYISEWSSIREEGPPSPPTTPVNVSPGDTVTVRDIPIPPEGENIARKWLYRTATDGVNTAFYFVADLHPDTTAFIDNLFTDGLGEILGSEGNDAPPADMHSLVAIPNGMMVGASGKRVCPSKAYLPHAFNPLHQLTLPSEVVALGAFDNTVVALTHQNPHLITGASPEYLSEIELKVGQGCVSKRSVVSGAGGVIYASPDGLMQIGPSGPRLITAPYFTRDEWRTFNPASMHGCLFENRYFCFYKASNDDKGGFILDPNDPDAGLTFLDFYATALFPDSLADYLFMVLDDEGTNKVYRFDADTFSTLRYVWRSASFVFPEPQTFQAARVIADSYRHVKFRLYYRDAREQWRLYYQHAVRDRQPFRLPGGSAWREWQVELLGNDPVSGADVAPTISQLAATG